METAKIIVGVIHIILSIIIIALILLQSGRQAGLGAIGGAADSFFGKNKGKTMDAMLGRFTKICAIGFLVTSLFLAYGDSIIKTDSGDTNITDTTEAPEVSAPVDAAGGENGGAAENVPGESAPAENEPLESGAAVSEAPLESAPAESPAAE